MVFTTLILLAGITVGVEAEEVRLVKTILEAKTEKHWVLDRTSNRNIVSVAATGVGFYGFAKAAKLGMMSKETASVWIKEGFTNMMNANRDNDGWLYHFLDLSGIAYGNSEVSSVDSVIFYVGAERAAQLLEDQQLLDYIKGFKEKISIAAMIDQQGYFYHGWVVENGQRKMLRSKWTHYNEGILIYKYFDRTFQPVQIHYDLPLFCYFYPLAFYPSEAQWKLHLGRAIDYQLTHAGRYGYSAMDGQYGYVVNSPYYVSPLAVRSTMKFFPLKAKTQLNQYKIDWLTPSISVNGQWRCNDHVLVDTGIALMLMENEDE